MSDFDCTTCGACCIQADRSTHATVPLTETDLAALTKQQRRRWVVKAATPGGTGHHLAAMHKGSGVWACPAWHGKAGKRSHCAIYETRPQVCADFPVGGSECNAARLREGVG